MTTNQDTGNGRTEVIRRKEKERKATHTNDGHREDGYYGYGAGALHCMSYSYVIKGNIIIISFIDPCGEILSFYPSLLLRSSEATGGSASCSRALQHANYKYKYVCQ